MSKLKIDIRKLKNFAISQLPKDWALRDILLGENDTVDVSTFLARLPVWLQLSTSSEAITSD